MHEMGNPELWSQGKNAIERRERFDELTRVVEEVTDMGVHDGRERIELAGALDGFEGLRVLPKDGVDMGVEHRTIAIGWVQPFRLVEVMKRKRPITVMPELNESKNDEGLRLRLKREWYQRE